MSTQHNGRRRRSWLVPVFGGAVLILVGGALFADQLGYALPYRWIFLTLLIPAAAAMADSIRLATVWGWRSIAPLSRLIAGLLFAAIGMLMFFELNTGVILPALIMALGGATVMRALLV